MKRPTAEHRAPRLVRTPKPPPSTSSSPKSFDSEAARQAWRQVAKTRGSTSLGQERPRSIAWGWFILLGLGLIAFVVVERTRRQPERAPDTVAAAETEKAPAAQAPPRPDPMPPPTGLRTPGYGTVPEPPPTIGTTPTAEPAKVEKPSLPKGIGVIATAPPMPGSAKPPSVAAKLSADVPRPAEPKRGPDRPRRTTPDEPESVLPAALPWRRRNAPAGTGEEYAKAFKKIPKARDDKPPVGGIASSGLHVDRVNMGTKYARGRCGGETRHFRMRDNDYANICFRVVHLRQTEKVLVRWELNGKLVRRTWVPIPPAHAYRTRAGLRLRPGYRGNWQVRVMSRDGVELATQVFRVD